MNYRSTERIIKLSEKIICNNKNVLQKICTEKEDKVKKLYFFTEKDAYEEAERIAYLLMKLRKKEYTILKWQ